MRGRKEGRDHPHKEGILGKRKKGRGRWNKVKVKVTGEERRKGKGRKGNFTHTLSLSPIESR